MENLRNEGRLENQRFLENSAAEYFLTKLKRTDDEVNVVNAELREVSKEIRSKNHTIKQLNEKLESLLKEENQRTVGRLMKEKNMLQSVIKKADQVLDEMGLIWVGENSADNPKRVITSCCCATGVQKQCTNNVDPVFKDDDHIKTSHHRSKNTPTVESVAPFSGTGYRLGTNNDRFQGTSIIEPTSSDSIKPKELYKTPKSNIPRAINTENIRKDEFDVRYQQPKFRKPSKTDGLPVELMLLSPTERQRIVRQTRVQIQKNINKYSF